MNVFAKFDEIPSMILEVIKETKRYRHTVGRSFGRSVGWSDGQRENSIPSHKHSLRGYKNRENITKTDTNNKQEGKPRHIEDITRVVISYEINQTGLRRV